ncbi:GNAT family N-acetyltransferase [Parafrigoribacterium soli]|uniref:GNAT family N-acetyltransferase n=1 Tax=Parafrigoribacterium soli TaxID=3144663 RepID=UPI0032F02A33
MLIEHAGERDFEGQEVKTSGGMVVGVYLDPEFRGTGTIDRLLTGALAWVGERGLHRARLYVHSDNLRAQRAYERVGFRATGLTIAGSTGRESELARDL